jgi:tripartite-type tricarboxylate transporter receptor subunit TctC
MTAVARSAPDGYRLVVTSGGSIAIASNFRKVGYDAERGLVPVAMIERTPCVIAVDASLPVKNLAELVKYSKEKPGGLSYGNSGPGSVFWAAGEILRHKSGANMVSVPYQGAILTARAIRAGEIEMGIADLTAVMSLVQMSFVQEGKIRILAVTDSTRSSLLPDIPTVSETIPGLGLNAWIGVLAPRGTPPQIVDQLNAGINEALRMPDVRQRFLNAGLEPWIMSRQEMAQFVSQEIVLWKKLIQEANLKE